MPLQPVTRRSVPDDVFDQVLAGVVDGEIEAGETLPSERRLAEVLGVSRPAVREALQRMAQTRLVEVRQGGSTTVRDFRKPRASTCCPACSCAPATSTRRWPAASSRPGSSSDPASPRSPPSEVAPPRPCPHRLVDALATTDDDVERQRHALAFWDLVVDAADSLTFRLMFNSLRAAYEPALEALAALMREEVGQIGAYRVLTAAIAEGDPDTARAAAERVLRPATRNLITALEALEETT